MKSRRTFLLHASLLLFLPFLSLADEPELGETALRPGDSVTIPGPAGKLQVQATARLERGFTWNGATRSLKMIEREKEWNGSHGCYYPGPGSHWKNHQGITRAVVEEGIRRFKNSDELKDFLRRQKEYFQYSYLGQSRIGAWNTVPERQQLNSSIWKILVAGREVSAAEWKTLTQNLSSSKLAPR